MNRTALTITVTLIAASNFLTSTAKACISCEHVPVVVRGSLTSDSPTRYTKQRYQSRAAAKAKARARAKANALAAAKAKAKAKARALAAAKSQAVNKVDHRKTINEKHSSVATASLALEKNKASDSEAKPTNDPNGLTVGGCRKYLPSLGTAVAIPCE